MPAEPPPGWQTASARVAAGVLAVAVGLVAAAAGMTGPGRRDVGGVASARVGVFGPSPSGEGVTWNHKEFFDHMGSNGLRLKVKPKSSGGLVGGPSMFASLPAVELESFDPDSLSFFISQQHDDLIVVEKLASPQRAKDEAGLYGDRGWSWGCFVVRGDPKLIASIRQRLT